MAFIPEIQDLQGLSRWFAKNLPVLVFIAGVGFWYNYLHSQSPYHAGMPGYVETSIEVATLLIERSSLMREINLMELSLTHNPDEYIEVNRMLLVNKKAELARVNDRLAILQAD